MEYVEGVTVKGELEKNGAYEEDKAIRIVYILANVIKFIHSREILHRNITPNNILIAKDGGVKLTGFGLSRLATDEKGAAAEAGMPIGTPNYMSPEQVRGSIDIDIRSDIYNLGATFYHMATGRVPFEGADPTEVMKKAVDRNVPLLPANRINTNISSGVAGVIQRMMARDRDVRYRDTAELISHLDNILCYK